MTQTEKIQQLYYRYIKIKTKKNLYKFKWDLFKCDINLNLYGLSDIKIKDVDFSFLFKDYLVLLKVYLEEKK